MDHTTRVEAARMLLEAYDTGKPIAPLTATYDDMTLEDAYTIQLLQIDEFLSAGRTI
jgi:2-keto-4-pentenoate hydratase